MPLHAVPYALAMAVDRAFSDLVASMDSAMVVVTVATEDERDGCLVGFHSQASIEPPAYVVWLSTANRTCRLAARADHLAVHLLEADQHDLAELFGGETGDDIDKLSRVAWEPGIAGVPLLTGCTDRFVGRIEHRLDVGGDHVGVILDPIEAAAGGSANPLRLGQATDIDAGHPA